MLQQIKNKLSEMLKGRDEPVVNFIPNLMKRVHKDKDGNLASRMNNQFVPLADLQAPKPKKFVRVWAGDKIHKSILRGTCAGKRVEGVAGGAIRLGKQARMLDKMAEAA